MSATSPIRRCGVLLSPVLSRRAARVLERNVLAYRRMWYVFLTGFIEPILYLLSIGVGVGRLVGPLSAGGTHVVSYREFVAPGLLAVAAMQGAILDTTFNFFVKFKYVHTYDAMLATPLDPRDIAEGEVSWALLRGAVYAAAFTVTMASLGLVRSWWALAAVPAAVLIGFAFAGMGMGGTAFMRSWKDFDFVMLAILPLFLFSGTFSPLSAYPSTLRWVVRVTPLYQGVAIERSLVLGRLSWALVGHAAYLAVAGAVGVAVASRRMGRLLLK